MAGSEFITSIFILIAFSVIYTLINIFSRHRTKNGRNPVNAYYNISQWNPSGVQINGSCKTTTLPGTCYIEGDPVLTRPATRVCASASCIDFEGNIMSGSTNFQASCGLPGCGWSKSKITFGNDIYVVVNDNLGLTLSNGTYTTATEFYMRRLKIGADSQSGSVELTVDMNGIFAQFFYLKGTNAPYMLCYTNQATTSPGNKRVTKLQMVQSSVDGVINGNFLTLFVLIDAMPTSVALNPDGNTVGKKIVLYGNETFTSDPNTTILADFIDRSQAGVWKALQNNRFLIPQWRPDLSPPGFYAEQIYTEIVSTWIPSISPINYDIKELRLVSPELDRIFYAWR